MVGNFPASPVPQIPIKGVGYDEAVQPTVSGLREQYPLPQLPETPFTKAKRKAVSRDLQPTIVLDDPFTYSSRSSDGERKAARTSTLSTPGQHFIQKLKSHAVSLPTPDSREDISASTNTISQPRLWQGISPVPGLPSEKISFDTEGDSDLTMSVLELIGSDNLELKVSTEMQLRHEIGLKLDVSETNLRRSKETISELRKRIDELETMVLHLTTQETTTADGINVDAV
jgi:hypothetical protein